jgi:imidazolonepropionase-like amidohydrolase/ABC-type multidrug transport system permease subunit
MRPYIAQIRSNLRLMGRDRAVLFFSYLLPLSLYFIFAQLSNASRDPGAMAQVLAMVIVIGVLSGGLFGAGMRTVQDRETNVLRRFKVAPITPMPLLISSIVSGVVSFVPTVFLYFLISASFYHMPLPAHFWSVLLFVCIAVVAFRTLGVIIAAVVNSANEAQILVQILYLPMLFLSGATFPVSIMPVWIQVLAGFLPATYLYSGLQSMLVGGESIAKNLAPVAALLVTTVVGLFIASKLFRWEKDERIAGRAKLWILAVLAPFFILGIYQGETKDNIQKQKALSREAERSRTILFDNVRIFVGDGRVIEDGAVLIKKGRIERVFDTPPKDTKSFDADVWDEAGRTLIPGLIDMHVHIGAPGGLYQDAAKYRRLDLTDQRLSAYLYCGITAVRSVGDWLDNALSLRHRVQSGEITGAEFFTYGPLFTAAGGHPTEMLDQLPAEYRATAQAQFVRLPNTPAQARQQVDDLKAKGVDGIKAVLEAGAPGWQRFNHLAPDIYSAVIQEAAKDGLPTATHTGDAEDVKEAIAAGTNTIEHGSKMDLIPAEDFAAMKAKGIAYDPTMSVQEALGALAAGNLDALNRPLVQRVVPSDLLADTRVLLSKHPASPSSFGKALLELSNKNLLAAYQAGAPLIAGSDAGNLLVFHGPTIQHELELWVKAGIPAAAALQAATYNAARYLHAEQRMGLIAPGHEATLVLLEGNPLEDISATERISDVFLKGEQIQRYKLVHQDKQ